MIDFPIRIPLVRPIDVKGSTYSEITIREPKARDYWMVAKKGLDPMAETTELIETLSGLPADVLAEMNSQDYFEVCEIIRPFSQSHSSVKRSAELAQTLRALSAGAAPTSST